LTGAQSAVVETPDGAVITSTPSRRRLRRPRSSLVVALPDTERRGAVKVYSAGRRAFGAEDVRALELLAGLVWSAVTRAALPRPTRRPQVP
jgi:GAF domain-containing protein